jgi:hypothetical protein
MSTNELAKPSPAHTTESGEDQARIGSGTVEPFQVIEPSGQDETEYPTGVKFAAVMIAISHLGRLG